MESSAPTASPSLKKLKREAAQRRKAQARSLKLRADEQERLQRLEIDALVEQQRLQRLERQRCEEDAAARAVQSSQSGNAGLHGGTLNDGKCGSNSNKGLSKQQQQQNQQLLLDRGDRDCPASCMDAEHNKKVKDSSSAANSAAAEATAATGSSGGVAGGWRGKESQRTKHAQQQSMRAAVESRRRLARGPRSGVVPDAHPTIPSEDHRVVSTEYQAAGTQALMRVTLLAAGFVIGARGISARLIGQVTGAIVQSWTESCRPDAVPIRLFRIQGKKAVVQAAVALIGQAVAKYKDLCDCKRRGEFVQREHCINGVEFYYQPPPRKAFAIAPEPTSCPGNNGGSNKPGALGGADPPHSQGVGVAAGGGAVPAQGPAVGAPAQLSFTPHHVWLQHLHAQQQQKQQEQKQQQQAHEHAVKCGTVPLVDNRSMAGRVMQQQGFFDWRQQQHSSQQQQLQQKQQPQPPQQQTVGQQQQQQVDHVQEHEGCGDSDRCTAELERFDHGLQQSVASLEQALQQVRLEQRLLQHNRAVTECPDGERNITNKQKESNLWAESHHERGTGHNFQLGSSLFSIFGTGELPIPVSHEGRSDATGNAAAMGILTSSDSSATPFDFPRCDFLRESLHAFPFTSRDHGPVPEYCLYGHTKNDSGSNLCLVCLEQPAGVRLMACGHSSFCLDCVQGLVNCPLCREKIVGLHQCQSRASSAPAGPAAQRGPPVAAKLNGSSYHLWNWVPGASV